MTTGRTFNVKKPEYIKEFTDKPIDTISDICFNSENTAIAVASWDKTVTIYRLDKFIATGIPFRKDSVFNFPSPVLSVCFFNNIVIGGCTNGMIVFFDTMSGAQLTGVQAHGGGVKGLCNHDNKFIISGSFDQTIKFWEVKENIGLIHVINLPSKVYSLKLCGSTLGVGLSDKTIQLYNLLNPSAPVTYATRFSYSIRSLALCADMESFAAGSIEAKVEIFSRTSESKKCIIRAHRDQNKLYSVNTISFFPKNYNIIVSGGGDGSLMWFDRGSRIKILNHSFPDAITAGSFSTDGTFYVFATGDDWSKGYTGVRVMPGLYFIDSRNVSALIK